MLFRSSTFVKTPAKKYFAKKQESARKDVERAFDILQAQFAIVRHPSLSWSIEQMWEIMNGYIIMHNMIIENECDPNVVLPPQLTDDHYIRNPFDGQGQLEPVVPGPPQGFSEFLAVHQQIHDGDAHQQLQDDLVAHLWERHGGEGDGLV